MIKIKNEDFIYSTEIVKLKDQLLRKVLHRPPDDPSDTHSAHTVLVTRGIDTIPLFSNYFSSFNSFSPMDSRNLEVPLVMRVCKWTSRTVNFETTV